MTRSFDLALTAIAPIIWGSSYIVATQFLLNLDPITVSLLRALPAGVLLLLLVRHLPPPALLPKMFVLGALNFAVFWALLFYAAYRLPGGIAAILGALQPLVVFIAARALLGTPVRRLSVLAVGLGGLGVALLVLTARVQLDLLGVIAGALGSVSMGVGTVLSRKWQPPVSPLTFTAWQLTAGGVLLLPFAPFATTDWTTFTGANILGLAYLGFIGAGATYVIWLRGIKRLDPSAVSILGILSPLSAALLGWAFLSETLSPSQVIGAIVVLCSVFLGQYALRAPHSQAARAAL